MEVILRPLFIQIMNSYVNARNETFKEHWLGGLLRSELPGAIKSHVFLGIEEYEVKGSIGQGNWAIIPWLAIMNPKVTTSTQRGYYIVYLFSEDMKYLYLTFAQGVTETTREEMEKRNKDIREKIPMDKQFLKDSNFALGTSLLATKYGQSIAAYVPYSIENLPTEAELVSDLKQMVGYYEKYVSLNENEESDFKEAAEVGFNSDSELISHIHTYITNKGFYFTKESITNFYLCLKTKPFIILSGISGTGKTKIVQLFAESVGATEDNGQFKMIPVRPDWSDGSDLIGYEDIRGDFKPGPFTKVLMDANLQENRDKPYFILLDEMNLARVEYYFSDLLSVMESRKKEEGEYTSTPIIDREEVGKLMLLNNVYIIGTVNMDETTYPFSPKVLDRANTIEYNEVELDHFSFYKDLDNAIPVTVMNDQLAGEFITLKDAFSEHEPLIREITDWLVQLNKILEKVKLHFGYRVRDEVCFYMIYNEQGELMSREQAFDLQLHQKILPRISGNDHKTINVLKELYSFCTNHIWDENSLGIVRKESRFPKSAEKITDMVLKIENDGFTSFWG